MLGRLVTIAAFENAMQATLVKNQMEAAGIRCVLADEFTASNFWQLSNAIGGVKVQIAEEDFERASKVLDALEASRRDDSTDESSDESTGDESPAAEADTESEHDESDATVPEPKPGDDDEDDDPPLNKREDDVERAYRTVLIGYIIWPLQLYATWLLLDVWQSDLPIRPAVQRRLFWAITLHLPMLIVAVVVIGLMFRGASSEFTWLHRGY